MLTNEPYCKVLPFYLNGHQNVIIAFFC